MFCCKNCNKPFKSHRSLNRHKCVNLEIKCKSCLKDFLTTFIKEKHEINCKEPPSMSILLNEFNEKTKNANEINELKTTNFIFIEKMKKKL
jgi:hypothetical protein